MFYFAKTEKMANFAIQESFFNLILWQQLFSFPDVFVCLASIQTGQENIEL